MHEGKCLVVQRRDSFGYLELLRGKYNPHDVEYLKILVNDMTAHERRRVLTDVFDDMWRDICNRPPSPFAREKFVLAKPRLKHIIDESANAKRDNGYEFPKGRRSDFLESDLQAARREFEEETCMSRYAIRVVPKPIVDEYVSYDGVRYRNTFYVATLLHTHVKCRVDPRFAHEIRKVRWCRVTHLPPRLRKLVTEAEAVTTV